VAPKKQYRLPTDEEAAALNDLAAALGTLPEGSSPEDIQLKVYDIGRRDPYKTTQKDGSVGVAQSWFNMLYQVLLGEEKWPRFGSFVALYGIANTGADRKGGWRRSRQASLIGVYEARWVSQRGDLPCDCKPAAVLYFSPCRLPARLKPRRLPRNAAP
jgi:hypothetical protein